MHRVTGCEILEIPSAHMHRNVERNKEVVCAPRKQFPGYFLMGKRAVCRRDLRCATFCTAEEGKTRKQPWICQSVVKDNPGMTKQKPMRPATSRGGWQGGHFSEYIVL